MKWLKQSINPKNKDRRSDEIIYSATQTLLRNRFTDKVCVSLHSQPNGEVVYHQNIHLNPDTFLKNDQPIKEDIVVRVDCMFT